ncbi:hypothetical protein KC353_g10 [Hortaea werneckii]|nr:hypothetical protein KC353_g10 [Hortaea werneckii]
MQTPCRHCEESGASCRVHLRSGRCCECIRLGSRYDLLLTHGEWSCLKNENARLEKEVEKNEEAKMVAMTENTRLGKDRYHKKKMIRATLRERQKSPFPALSPPSPMTMLCLVSSKTHDPRSQTILWLSGWPCSPQVTDRFEYCDTRNSKFARGVALTCYTAASVGNDYLRTHQFYYLYRDRLLNISSPAEIPLLIRSEMIWKGSFGVTSWHLPTPVNLRQPYGPV